MVRKACAHEASVVREMWKECFGDTEEFMDLYFSRKWDANGTLIYFIEGHAVASLQMHLYHMTFYGEEIPLFYLSGLCTLPRHRGKGYASELIAEAHREAHRHGVPLTVLMPARTGLYKWYARFGYEKVFESDDCPIPLGEMLDSSSNLREAYVKFNAVYEKMDFCIQKSFDDFAVIAADYLADGRPVKTNRDGAACLIDYMPLLRVYAKNNPALSFTLNDSLKGALAHETAGDAAAKGILTQAAAYSAAIGAPTHEMMDDAASTGVVTRDAVIVANKSLLTRVLFGYNTSGLPEPYRTLFPEHHPVMNLMLE